MQLLSDRILELEHDNVGIRVTDCGQRVTGIAYDHLAEPFTLFEQFRRRAVRARNPLSTQRGSQTNPRLLERLGPIEAGTPTREKKPSMNILAADV